MSAQPELFETPRAALPREMSDLEKQLAFLVGAAREQLAKCRQNPRHENWALEVGRTQMKNYGASSAARVASNVLGVRL